MAKITLRQYQLETDTEVKVIPDGYEIFKGPVERLRIDPVDFVTADWTIDGGIIVYTE